MSEGRITVGVPTSLIERIDAAAEAQGLKRSLFVRDLIHQQLDGFVPRKTERVARVRQTNMGALGVGDQPGVPVTVIYRLDGTFCWQSARTVRGLYETVDEYREGCRSPRARDTEQAWEEYMSRYGYQAVSVSSFPYVPGEPNEPVPGGECEINALNLTGPNGANVRLAPLTGYEEEYDELIDTLNRAAAAWCARWRF